MKRSGPVTKYKRTNFPRYARAANIIGAAYKRYKGRSYTQTKQQKPKAGVQGITTFQKDVKQVYRYKRAPTKLRRKWSRGRKAFVAHQLKELASRKYHYSGNMTWSTNANAQGWFGWYNYGANGTGGVDGSGDIADMFIRLNAELLANGTNADNKQGGNNSRRFYFDHMRARVILTNTGTTPIFWELFECTARKDVPITEGSSLQNFFGTVAMSQYQGSLDTTAGGAGVPDSAQKISAASRPAAITTGATPFQFRHFCQNFKITKVTRLQAAPGNTVSFDASSPRNVRVNWDDYVDLVAKKGITKMYLVRQWGTVELINSVPQNSASSAVCEVEKDYNVKVLDSHVPELNYFTYTNTTE